MKYIQGSRMTNFQKPLVSLKQKKLAPLTICQSIQLGKRDPNTYAIFFYLVPFSLYPVKPLKMQHTVLLQHYLKIGILIGDKQTVMYIFLFYSPTFFIFWQL